MLQLRDYQDTSVEKALCFLMDPKRKDNEIIILPTGAGKSLVIATVAMLLDEPVIVFQPSKEILEQNYQKLIDYGAFDVSIFSASMNRKKISKITLATIGSAINQIELFKTFKYIIVDECHLVNPYEGMYKRFFELINCKILGLTASPFRMYSNSMGVELRFITRTHPRIFKHVCHYEQISTMCERGYWAKLKYFTLGEFYTSRLKLNSTGSGYTEESIRKYYEEIKFNDKLTKVIDKLYSSNRKNILVFTEFVEEAEVLAKIYEGTSAIVSGETPKPERKQILSDFKSGKIKMIANVGVLTTGFDFPELETIVLARPTRSLGLYYQMVGRAVRPHPNKKEAFVIDLCENYKRFGPVESIKIGFDDKGHWCITNGEKQLTNVYIK